MRFLLTLLLILPMLLAPAFGMAPASAIDMSVTDATGTTARAWSNARKRCGMAQNGQQRSGCVVDLIAILARADAATSRNRPFHLRANDFDADSHTPRPLTKPPRP